MTSTTEVLKNTHGPRILLAMGITTIALTIAAVGIPNLLRSRIAANEASAVGSLRTLDTALATYSAQHPNEGYPQKMSDLTPYIDSKLASGEKSGYRFRYVPETQDTDGVVKAFHVEAAPISTQSGVRRFSSDETADIRYQASLTEPEKSLADASPEKAEQTSVRTSAKMIRKTALNLIVEEPSVAAEKIRLLASRLGGYVESVRSSDEGTAAKQTSIAIRVPSDRLDEARHEVRGFAERVSNEQDDARDVSSHHVDLESHLRNYRAEEAQYLDIMRRSGTIKDTLAVSEHLADVRGRIERTQGQLDQLAQQTEMALLEVNLRTELAPQPMDVRWHPGAEIKSAFWTAVDDLSTYANFMIEVLFRLPVFALWTFTILTSLFGGWRLLTWTWRRFVPSAVPVIQTVAAEPSHGN
jgi:type IV pilus assembly protein PilA